LLWILDKAIVNSDNMSVSMIDPACSRWAGETGGRKGGVEFGLSRTVPDMQERCWRMPLSEESSRGSGEDSHRKETWKDRHRYR
jgi:hypothetical protein